MGSKDERGRMGLESRIELHITTLLYSFLFSLILCLTGKMAAERKLFLFHEAVEREGSGTGS
jgi:hypothetical protein